MQEDAQVLKAAAKELKEELKRQASLLKVENSRIAAEKKQEQAMLKINNARIAAQKKANNNAAVPKRKSIMHKGKMF